MYRSSSFRWTARPFANSALPVAITLASRGDAEVHLVHVREPILFLEGSSAYEPHLADDHQMEVRAHITSAAAHLSRESSLRVDAEFLAGQVVPTLRQYLENGDHDLVVMMTHGRGGWNRAWLGSVADGLIRSAPVPLLLLRHESQWLRDAVEPLFCRVLIPLDGSAMAEEVLERVLSLGVPDATEYVLLSVIAPHRESEPGESGAEGVTARSHDEQQRDAAHNYLNRVAGDLRSRGAMPKVSVEVYRHTSVLPKSSPARSRWVSVATLLRAARRNTTPASCVGSSSKLRRSPRPGFPKCVRCSSASGSRSKRVNASREP